MEPTLDTRTLPGAGDDLALMDSALAEARAAGAHDDVPIGAVVGLTWPVARGRCVQN